MFTRRRFAGLVAGSTLLTTGCLGVLTGEESYSESAQPARTAESTAGETGYEFAGTEEQVIEEEFEVAGQTRSVEATNYVSTYEKTMEVPVLGEAKTGVFAVVSTPAFEIAGRTLNPISEYSNAELVDLLASEYEQLEVREEVGTDELSILDTTVEVSKFDAVATFEGQEIDVFVHVGSFQHEEDFLVPVGIYPQDRENEEEPNVVALFENVTHPIES